MGTIDTLLRVKADASGAVRGLAPLQASLEATATSATKTETALDTLGGQHKISLNTEAIASARTEIDRLRDDMAKRLLIDPQADVRDAQRQISTLQKNIKTLDAEHPVVDVGVNVEADTTGLAAARGAIQGITAGISQGAGGGLVQGLGAARAGMSGLGAETAVAGAALGVFAIAGGVAAGAALEFGQAAADVETSVTQLGALTGDQEIGKELFADLQDWAKATPFAIDDATEAAKKLLAAGVPLSEITDNLSDMGNVASATGVPLAQIATVFAQMESKGKATFEELQQLAEAGVPVWSTLADNMGLTVAQVQKMATEGKLGADAIDLVREAMGAQFPTAMSDQAATFNGQMSTFHDTLDQTGQTLGLLFLPLMTDLVGAFNEVAGWLQTGTEWLVKFDDKLQDITGSGAVDTLLNIATIGSWTGIKDGVDALNDLGTATEDTGDSAVMTDEEIQALADSVTEDAIAQQQAAAATQAHADEMQRLADKVSDTKSKYDDLVDSFSIMDDRFVSQQQHISDVQGSIDDLAESLVKGGGTFDLDKVAGRDNFDNLVTLGEAAGQRVEDTFKTKGPAAAAALENSFRGTFTQMLTDAGTAPKRAKQLIDQVFKTPVQVRLELQKIDVAQLRKQKATLLKKKADLELPFQTRLQGETNPRAIDQISLEMENKVKPVNAKIEAKTTKIDQAQEDLDKVANPKDKPRTAKIDAKVTDTSLTTADQALNTFIHAERPAIKLKATVDVEVPTITVSGVTIKMPPPVYVPGGQSAPAPAPPPIGPEGLRAAGAAMMATPTAAPWFGSRGRMGIVPGSGDSGGQQQVTRLAPKQVPVAVYLDGVEIASRIADRHAMARVESVRRTA